MLYLSLLSNSLFHSELGIPGIDGYMEEERKGNQRKGHCDFPFYFFSPENDHIFYHVCIFSLYA